MAPFYATFLRVHLPFAGGEADLMPTEAGTSVLLLLAGAAALAWLAALLHGRGARPLRDLGRLFGGQPPAGRVLLGAFAAAAWLFAGAKPGGSPDAGLRAHAGLADEADAGRGFALTRAGTGESFDFAPPPGARVATNWALRGASSDWARPCPGGWAFASGGESATGLVVFAGGRVLLPSGVSLAPVGHVPLGLVPAANEGLLAARDRPSRFWHAVREDGVLLLTWRNALFRRRADSPVSLQAELRPTGGVTFRYDLSRLASDGLLEGVCARVGGQAHPLLLAPGDPASAPRRATSLSFASAEEARCDAARAAFGAALGGADPLGCPPGSTNTVWEHWAATGTTNAPFAWPESTDRTAVLRVTASGAGRGELLVGGRAVPLVGEGAGGGGRARAASAPRVLLLPVPRGADVALFLRADGTLSVSLASDDFAFGVLPDPAARRHAGRVNFPFVRATAPCFHDYRARQTRVGLPVGEGAEALVCAWTGSASVRVEAEPPRAATLTGLFDGRAAASVSYSLSHPDYLFGTAVHSQEARFCPRPPESEADPRYGARDGEEGEEEWPCRRCLWGPCRSGGEFCPCGGRCFCASWEDPGGRPGGPSAEGPEDCGAARTNFPHLAGVLRIREPPLFSETVLLELPDGGAPRCCPCPGHATNFAAVAYLSERLKAVDADGRDFVRAAETAEVRLAGVRPSASPGDAFASFVTNGAVASDAAYTVLGVGVRRAGLDLAGLAARAPGFGLPVPVGDGPDGDGASLDLVTDVGLPGGRVRVGFEGADAGFALWTADAETGGWRLLADAAGGPLEVPLAEWRRLVCAATDADASRTSVRVTASAPGSGDLVFRYWGVFGGRFVEDEARLRLTALAPRLRADVDHDGRLGSSDDVCRLSGRPFRFWFNEDREKGDHVGQSGDLSLNADDLRVNGKLDLVNLFPVAVDVSPFLRAWGDAAEVRLHAGSQMLRYCVLDGGFSPDAAHGLASSPVRTANGIPLESAELTPLGWEGVDARALVSSSQGTVFLALEAAGPVKSRNGLELVVSIGGSEVYRERLPVSIFSVDEMYRHFSLRGAEVGGAFSPVLPGEPGNLPDSETDGRQFIFVHGYNVSAAKSREWARAMFKRLWWAGSRSMFAAVDWRGDDSRLYVPTRGDVSPNYYVNVRHAFRTAAALKAACAELPGDKVLLAHSLGNMLVSSAVVDHGLAYGQYYMLNAAVPMEAYGRGECCDLMVDGAWKDVDDRVRASRFYSLFDTEDYRGDFRRTLSWKGRFAGIRNAVNCYSPTEDVLANPTRRKIFGVQSEGFGGAWSMQELFKGCALWYGLNAATFAGAEIEGGWGINARYVANPLAYVPLVGFNAGYFADCTREDLIRSPLFTSFDDSRMTSTNVLDFVDEALRAKMLGDAIPAESFAAGANETDGVDENVNLQDCAPDTWPRWKDGRPRWLHSDIKDVSYFYTVELFRLILRRGP